MLPDWLRNLVDFVPAGVAAVVAVAALLVARLLLDRAAKRRSTTPGVRSHAIMLALTLAALLLVIVLLPISDSTREQLLSFLGILISATIALASTTFLGNAMAGLMLRALRNFRPGDFIRVGEHFGRVTERGIFHIELQTEDRDLTTLPNLHLVNNPVTVVRASGTILSANVSLGYDVAHPRVERLLLEAAAAAGLRDGFVHVTELGDHAVSYRVAGLLTEVRHILSARSTLRVSILDALHRGGVEIVSPGFINQRRLSPETRVIPTTPASPQPAPVAADAERIAFDKAEEAASLEALGDRLREVEARIDRGRDAVKEANDDSERAHLEAQVAALEASKARLEARLEAKPADDDRG